MMNEEKRVVFNSSFIIPDSSLSFLFLLAAGRDDLLGLLERGLQAVAVAVLEFRERARGEDCAAYHFERELDAVGHLRAGRYLREVNAELHHRLRNRRADAGEY